MAQERPCAFADRVGAWYTSLKSSQYRKAHGLYLTPVPIADFMATQVDVASNTLRLLDPAAGAGVLCCAAVERLAARPDPPTCIELVAYEDDSALRGPLGTVLGYLSDWCRGRGVRLAWRIETADFVAAEVSALRSLGELLPSCSRGGDFDVVIANPPYFKIGRNDPRALAASSVVHGQPNIYALFMAVGAAMLRQAGGFVYIVPRSFASGLYFRQFRSTFFELMQPTAVHVFGSRRSAFSRHDVLQENVVLAARRRDGWLRNCRKGTVVISASRGVADIGEPSAADARERAVREGQRLAGATAPLEQAPARRRAPLATVLDPDDQDKVLRLPLCNDDAQVLKLVERWPCVLGDLGLKISTGPVVPFRSAASVCATGEVPATHAPLLWMNHIRPMRATWPLGRRKKEFFLRNGAERLLVPNQNYVLIRRFSAKEERRRLTAAPYVAGRFDCADLGLENHLNYVHRPHGTLSEDECWGLAALYSSSLLDRYFRCINGNTQVSATELRTMPLPTAATVTALGSRVKRAADPLSVVDDMVMGIGSLPWPRPLSRAKRPKNNRNNHLGRSRITDRPKSRGLRAAADRAGAEDGPAA